MRVFTTLPQQDLCKVAAAAREVEADGYDGVAAMENKHDPFLALAIASTATERIQLHTSVAIAFARSPMAVANVGWDLAGATGGRFVIGLGSQVRAHNERRFSVPWTPPAPRMREYVQALRAIWRCWKTGEKLNYEGRHYRFTLMTPGFTPEPIDAAPPAVTIAAVGPAMLKVAAEECDGVKLHGFCTRKYLEEAVMPRLADGFDRLVYAPDWRGFGLTETPGTDTYWFPDYVADLDALLDHFSAVLGQELRKAPELPSSSPAFSVLCQLLSRMSRLEYLERFERRQVKGIDLEGADKFDESRLQLIFFLELLSVTDVLLSRCRAHAIERHFVAHLRRRLAMGKAKVVVCGLEVASLFGSHSLLVEALG